MYHGLNTYPADQIAFSGMTGNEIAFNPIPCTFEPEQRIFVKTTTFHPSGSLSGVSPGAILRASQADSRSSLDWNVQSVSQSGGFMSGLNPTARPYIQVQGVLEPGTMLNTVPFVTQQIVQVPFYVPTATLVSPIPTAAPVANPAAGPAAPPPPSELPVTGPVSMDEQEDLQRILGEQFRGRMLPPPLTLETHDAVWMTNKHQGDDDVSPSLDLSEGVAESLREAFPETPRETAERLEAYKVIMCRWCRHAQVLQSKSEVRARLPRLRRACPTLEETRRRLERDGVMEDEDVLRQWGKDCTHWWQDIYKKRTRKVKKDGTPVKAELEEQSQTLPPPPPASPERSESAAPPPSVSPVIGLSAARALGPPPSHLSPRQPQPHPHQQHSLTLSASLTPRTSTQSTPQNFRPTPTAAAPPPPPPAASHQQVLLASYPPPTRTLSQANSLQQSQVYCTPQRQMPPSCSSSSQFVSHTAMPPSVFSNSMDNSVSLSMMLKQPQDPVDDDHLTSDLTAEMLKTFND